jgi:hypothetical protein
MNSTNDYTLELSGNGNEILFKKYKPRSFKLVRRMFIKECGKQRLTLGHVLKHATRWSSSHDYNLLLANCRGFVNFMMIYINSDFKRCCCYGWTTGMYAHAGCYNPITAGPKAAVDVVGGLISKGNQDDHEAGSDFASFMITDSPLKAEVDRWSAP